MKRLLFFTIFFLIIIDDVFTQRELIINGDFSSSSSWVISSPYWIISSSFSCYSSPTGYAYVGTSTGGGANNTYGSLYQTVTIPSNATSAILTFRISVSTDETATTSQNDVIQVQFRDQNMNLLNTFATYSNLDGTYPSSTCQTYQTKTFSIPSNYYGQTLRLNFQTASDDAYYTKFRIDDVSLTYIAASCTNSVAAISANANPSTINQGSASTLSIVGGSLGTNASWKWYSDNCGDTYVGSGSSINVSPSSTTTYYVRAEGDCNITNCVNTTVTVNSACINSTDPTSANANPSTINQGSSSTLSVVGGALGTNASWKWYSGSCGDTYVGSGSSINISPSSTTTYYVRAEGDCNITNCVNTQVVVTTSNPSQITVQTDIHDNTTFPLPRTLWNGTTNETPVTIKICADASKATQITFVNNTGINSNNIRFWIASDPNGSNSDVSGYFVSTDYTITGNTVTAKLTHPKYLQANYKPSRSDAVKIVDYTNSNTPIFTIPIEIYRAPVIMVHGLWGDATSFDAMENSLDNSGYYINNLTLKVDYSYMNSWSFGANQMVVPENINSILLTARANNFSAGKVDVICHSMGGILAREYIQSSSYRLKQDIRELITINTPHSGSQAANLLLNSSTCEGIGANAAVSYWLFYESLTNWKNAATIYDGAVEDLKVNSQAIHDLNVTNLNNGVVPTHCIVTEDDPSFFSDLAASFITTYISASLPCTLTTVSNFTNNLFYGEPNDYIVPLSSEEGGLPSLNISHYYNQAHVGAESNPYVITQVTNLLNIDPTNSNFFSQSGFSPTDLSNNTQYFTDHKLDEIKPDGVLNITYPISSQSFNPGDTVHVSFNSSNGINKTVLEGLSTGINVFAKDTILSNGTIDYVIPQNAFDKVGIIILGYDTTVGFIDYDTVSLKVNLTSTLDSIRFYPDTIYVQVKQNALANITGYFSNGNSYNISNSDGVQYQLTDTNIARHPSANLVTGKQIGITSLFVSYLGKTVNIPIVVVPEDTTSEVVLATNLISFTGEAQQSYNTLKWQVAGDSYLNKFILQRSSNSSQWINVTSFSNQSSHSTNNYQYNDASSNQQPLVYYRLIMINKDGTSAISNTVLIKRSMLSANVQIFPNPVTNGEVYISFSSTSSSKTTIYIIDISGKTLKIINLKQQNNSPVRLSLFGLKPAVYILKVQNGTIIKNIKLVVLK